MDDWFSFILFAVFFYVMMRYGCGAHMIHGHGHDKKHRHQIDEQKHVDPVCGMQVDMNNGYGKMYQGKLYRFCSRKCLDVFESKPDQYVKASNKQGVNV